MRPEIAPRATPRVMEDPLQIRLWACERGAHPVLWRRTGEIGLVFADEAEMLRRDQEYELLDWDEFFGRLESERLGLLYLAGAGPESEQGRFFRFVRRDLSVRRAA